VTTTERIKALRLSDDEVTQISLVEAITGRPDEYYISLKNIADAQFDKLLRGLVEIINTQIWDKTPTKEAMIMAGRQVGKQLTSMAETSKLFGYLSALEDTELMLREALELQQDSHTNGPDNFTTEPSG